MWLRIYTSSPSRCVDKYTGNPIFGMVGSETESVATGQNCACARNYYDGLKQGCKMAVAYNGEGFESEYQVSMCVCVYSCEQKISWLSTCTNSTASGMSTTAPDPT